VCVVGKMRDLILQLSKSSIYSTKPLILQLSKSSIYSTKPSLNCQAAASLFKYLKLKGGSSWTPLGGLKMPPPDEETKLFLQNNTTLTELTLEMMHKHRANLKAKLFNN
ncbi:hypothetical protein ACLHXY_27120, partial [Klebsiella quasipneumoniae]